MRTFLFDDTGGTPIFKLLPTDPLKVGHYRGYTIDDAGNILGQYDVDGDASQTSLFSWTPLDPYSVTLLLTGHNFATSCRKMSNGWFCVHCAATSTFKVFSYAVDQDTGVFGWFEDAELTTPFFVGRMSSDGLVPFTTRTVEGPTTRYAVSAYDAVTGQTAQCSPSNTYLVGSVNSLGEVVFDSGDGDLKLYRCGDGTHKVYDLLSAEAQLLLNPSRLNGLNALVSDSGLVAGVIAGVRGYVLTPIQ